MSQQSPTSVFRKRDLPLYYLLYLVSLLPFAVLYKFSDGLSWLFWNVIKYRKNVVLNNLQASFPGLTEQKKMQIGREFYRNLTDVILETVKLTSISAEELKSRIYVENNQALIDHVAAGNSFVILASHHCNWEWVFAIGPSAYDLAIYGVYKPLKSTFFETYMRYIRTRQGGVLIKMKETMRQLVTTRREPKAVSMVADQTPPFGEIQHWTYFLNQETAFYAGAEKIAKAFNYPVYFVHSHRLSRGHYKLIVERIDDQVTPERAEASNFPIIDIYAEKLEALIKSEPAAYLWSHKRWKHKRSVKTENIMAAGIN